MSFSKLLATSIVATVAVLSASATSAVTPYTADAANIIADGGFEEPEITPGTIQCHNTGDKIGRWTVVSKSGNTNCVVYVISTTYTESGGALKFPAKAGKQLVDLTGSFNQGNNGVSQVVRGLVVNNSYTLSFYVGTQDNSYAGYHGPGIVNVMINGVDKGNFSNTFTSPNMINWKKFSVKFVATSSSATIQFLNNQSVSNLTGLDKVLVAPALH